METEPNPEVVFTDPMNDAQEVASLLSREFPRREHQFRLQAKSKDGSSGLFFPYLDARVMQARLDEVVGPFGWEEETVVQEISPATREAGGKRTKELLFMARCSLSVLGVTRTGWGENDTPKGAATDAFKRACFQFGVGRYLYSWDKVWQTIDEHERPVLEDPKNRTVLRELLIKAYRPVPSTTFPPIKEDHASSD